MADTVDELKALVTRHARGSRTETTICGVSLLQSRTTTEPTAGMTELTMCLVFQGEKDISCGVNALVYGEGHYFVATIEIPVVGRISRASRREPFLGIGFNFDQAALAELIAEMPESGDPDLMCGLGISPTQPELADAFLRLIRLLDRPGEIPVLAPMLKREILFRLLQGPQGAKLRQIAYAGSRQSNLRRALGWMRENYTEPFKVEDLARMAGMSVSVFHRQFKVAPSLTPIQYQKSFRLHEARRLLLEKAGDAAGVAFAVGYESVSQFSREYARMFGAPPVRDVARLKTTQTSSYTDRRKAALVETSPATREGS